MDRYLADSPQRLPPSAGGYRSFVEDRGTLTPGTRVPFAVGDKVRYQEPCRLDNTYGERLGVGVVRRITPFGQRTVVVEFTPPSDTAAVRRSFAPKNLVLVEAAQR